MPINKGPISAALWRVFEVSLQRTTFFSKYYVNGGGVYGFLTLVRDEPALGEVVKEIILDDKWRDADLYSVTAGGKLHRFIFASDGKNRELRYPDRVDDDVEIHLHLQAALKAQQGLIPFLWREEGGWVLMFFYPVLGALTAFLGYEMLLLSTEASNMAHPSTMYWLGAAVIAAGAMVASTPAVSPWWKRRKIRRALNAVAHEMVSEGLAPLGALVH